MVPLALGTQTKGSVIRPASFCGIYGFKPTFGTIPRTGVLAQAPSLDTVGVYGRSIEDVALIADVLSVYDDRDAASLAGSRGRMLATAMRGLAAAAHVRLRQDACLEQMPTPSTHEAFGELVEQLGDQAHEISIDSHLPARRRMPARSSRTSSWPCISARSSTARPTRSASRWASRSRRAGACAASTTWPRWRRARIYVDTLEEIFLDYGTILTPPARGVAPKGFETTGDPDLLRACGPISACRP